MLEKKLEMERNRLIREHVKPAMSSQEKKITIMKIDKILNDKFSSKIKKDSSKSFFQPSTSKPTPANKVSIVSKKKYSTTEKVLIGLGLYIAYQHYSKKK